MVPNGFGYLLRELLQFKELLCDSASYDCVKDRASDRASDRWWIVRREAGLSGRPYKLSSRVRKSPAYR